MRGYGNERVDAAISLHSRKQLASSINWWQKRFLDQLAEERRIILRSHQNSETPLTTAEFPTKRVQPRSLLTRVNENFARLRRGSADLCRILCGSRSNAIIVGNYFGSGPSTNDDSARHIPAVLFHPSLCFFSTSFSRSPESSTFLLARSHVSAAQWLPSCKAHFIWQDLSGSAARERKGRSVARVADLSRLRTPQRFSLMPPTILRFLIAPSAPGWLSIDRGESGIQYRRAPANAMAAIKFTSLGRTREVTRGQDARIKVSRSL